MIVFSFSCLQLLLLLSESISQLLLLVSPLAFWDPVNGICLITGTLLCLCDHNIGLLGKRCLLLCQLSGTGVLLHSKLTGGILQTFT